MCKKNQNCFIWHFALWVFCCTALPLMVSFEDTIQRLHLITQYFYSNLHFNVPFCLLKYKNATRSPLLVSVNNVQHVIVYRVQITQRLYQFCTKLWLHSSQILLDPTIPVQASDPITYQTDIKRAFKRLKGNLHQLFNIIS